MHLLFDIRRSCEKKLGPKLDSKIFPTQKKFDIMWDRLKPNKKRLAQIKLTKAQSSHAFVIGYNDEVLINVKTSFPNCKERDDYNWYKRFHNKKERPLF